MRNPKHVSVARAAELAAKVLVPVIVEGEKSIADQLAIIRNGMFNQYLTAKEAGDFAMAASAASKFNENVMTSARVLDGMKQTGSITINTQVNNFADSPACLAIVDVVLDNLRDLPERRAAIAKAIRALNDEPLPPKLNGSRFVAEPVTIEGAVVEEMADADG